MYIAFCQIDIYFVGIPIVKYLIVLIKQQTVKVLIKNYTNILDIRLGIRTMTTVQKHDKYEESSQRKIPSSNFTPIKIIIKIPTTTNSENKSSRKDTNEKQVIIPCDKQKDNVSNVEWKSLDFLGYSKYEVSNRGKVRNKKSKKEIKPTLRAGYDRVGLTGDNKKQSTQTVHVLQAKTFIPNDEKKPTVDHIDRITSNNNLENLRWATHEEQNKNQKPWSFRTGRPVRQLDEKRNLIKEWDNARAATKAYNVSKGIISFACKHGSRSLGYYWEYNEIEQFEGEEWKDIPLEGFNEVKVSSFGRIHRPHSSIKYFEGSVGSEGYRHIELYNSIDHQYHRFSIHSLVAMTFHGERPLGKVINHIDGNKGNNRKENLEYLTQSENILHAFDIGLLCSRKAVTQYDMKSGKEIDSFKSITEASDKTGCSTTDISKVCNGEQLQSHGFIFRYTEDGPPDEAYLRNAIENFWHKRPVIQYDLNGKEIERFTSLADAGDKTNINRVNIGQVCRDVSLQCKGFIFRYEEDGPPSLENVEKVNRFYWKRRPVVQYDLDGKELGRFETIKAAADSVNLNPSSVQAVCNGKLVQCKGFLFRYIKNGAPSKEELKKVRTCKGTRSVIQCDLKGQELARFESMSAASRATSINDSCISRACSGKLKQSGGFIWKYEWEG